MKCLEQFEENVLGFATPRALDSEEKEKNRYLNLI